MMLSGVICDRQQLKVFQSVVVLDSVAMVDVLSLAQTPSKVCLHDETMLKAILAAANVGPDVSACELVAPSSPVAVFLSGPSACWVAAGS